MKTTMYKRNITKVCSALLMSAVLIPFSAHAQDSKLSFSGFGEVNASTSFGEVANEKQEELHHLFPSSEEQHLEDDQLDFGIPGFDLIGTARLSDNVISRAELFFENEEDAISIKLLQLQIQYQVSEKFNLKVGKFLTPIGYLNLNQRFFGYLNYSYRSRDMVKESLGYAPVSMVGLQFNGKFFSNDLVYGYKVAIGQNRGTVPHETVLSATFDTAPGIVIANDFKKSFKNVDVTLGLSGYYNPEISTIYLDSLGKEGELETDHGQGDTTGVEGAPSVLLRELGLTPYLKVDHDKFQVLVEYHSMDFSQISEGVHANGDKINVPDYNYQALSAQLMFKTNLLKKPFYPYVRYDWSELGNGGYYLGLEEIDGSHDELQRVYRPDNTIAMIGAAWDVSAFSRVKLEYSRKLNGHELENTINFGTSFAF